MFDTTRTLPIWIALGAIAAVIAIILVVDVLAADDPMDQAPTGASAVSAAPHAGEHWTIPLQASDVPVWASSDCRFGLTLHHHYPYAWELVRMVELDGRLDLQVDGEYTVSYYTWVRLGEGDPEWITRLRYPDQHGPDARLALGGWEYLYAPEGGLTHPLTVGLEVFVEDYEWGTCSDTLNPIRSLGWASRPELTVSIPTGVPPHLADADSSAQLLNAQVYSPTSLRLQWEPAPGVDYDEWQVEYATGVAGGTWTTLGTLTSPQDRSAPLEWVHDAGAQLATGVHRFRVRGYSQATYEHWQLPTPVPTAPDGYGEWAHARVTVRAVQLTPTPAPTATPVPTVTPIPFFHVIQMTPTPAP